MTNPRDKIRFVNARVKRETFLHDDTIVYDTDYPGNSPQVGLAVTQTGEATSTVTLVPADVHVTGRLEKVEGDGKCTVTVWGVVELPAGEGAALTSGAPIVGALGPSSAKGYIKASASGSDAVVAAARGEIKKSTDSTRVEVDLY